MRPRIQGMEIGEREETMLIEGARTDMLTGEDLVKRKGGGTIIAETFKERVGERRIATEAKGIGPGGQGADRNQEAIGAEAGNDTLTGERGKEVQATGRRTDGTARRGNLLARTDRTGPAT